MFANVSPFEITLNVDMSITIHSFIYLWLDGKWSNFDHHLINSLQRTLRIPTTITSCPLIYWNITDFAQEYAFESK